MKDRYQTIVLGATYAGLGFASSHPDCLVLEEFQTVGGDFHHSLHPAQMDMSDQRAMDSELGRLMREYGVLTDSGFDLLKASPVAHEYVSRKLTEGMEILLDARIISVDSDETGVTVRFITSEGISSVCADRLVDATVDCISAPNAVRCTGKTLNVFTVCMEDGFDSKLKAVCPDCRIVNGFEENEKLVLFPIPIEETMPNAYLGMMQIWRSAFSDSEEKILFVADDFDATYEPCAENAQWLGNRAANPLEAFLKGVEAQ